MPAHVVAEDEVRSLGQGFEGGTDVLGTKLTLKQSALGSVRPERGDLVQDSFARSRRLDVDAHAAQFPLGGGRRLRRKCAGV